MVELNDLRTMKGFPDSFLWFNIWCLVICFTIPRTCLVYGGECDSVANSQLTATIQDVPYQKVNTSLKDIPNASNVKLGLIINDTSLKNALKLINNVTTKLWQLKLVKSLDMDAKKYKDMKIQLICRERNLNTSKDFYLFFKYFNTYPPSFSGNPYIVKLPESTPINTTVFSLKDKIKDKDFWPGRTNSSYGYSLHPNIPVFDIESNGNVILRRPLDYESKNRDYNFTLFVKDLGDGTKVGAEINTTLEFKVLNDDDLSPQFTQKFFHVNIFENVTIGSTYNIEPRPKAIDGDKLNPTIIYTLTDKPSDFDKYFTFLANTMAVKVMTRLDQIPSSTFEVIIKASQADRPSDRYDIGFLVINVFGINKNIPVMTEPSYQASVRENALPSTLLLQVKATDKDGNSLEYKMQPPTEGISLDKTNGLITLRKHIDPKIGPIKFQVWTQESSTSKKYQSNKSNVTIKIIDENDHSPMFSSSVYTFSIKQTAPIDTQVGMVKATDEDQGLNGQIIYDLVGNPNAFTIDSGGNITMNKKLNAMKVDKYRFMVIAKDRALNHSRSTSAFVEVNVQKENIFAPKFPADMTSEISIWESTPQGTIVLDVFAKDDDLDNLTYTVKPDDTFGIKSSTNSGCSFLYLKKELDTENISSYSLQIIASDTIHAATHVLNVTVLGVNDMYPTFVQSTYNFHVEENKSIGQFVGTVQAIDKDINPSESIKYSLLENSNFKIDPKSGRITTRRVFDILEPTNLAFVAFASDDGSPKALTASCLVNIAVVDINNHIPEFSLQSVQLIVLEDKMNDLIYPLKATDKDIDPKFKIIVYAIQNSTSTFVMLKNKRDLYLKSGQENKVLGRTVSVIVEAFNKDRPGKKNSINITITFKDINNKVPHLLKPLYQRNIFENSTVGSTIITVKAKDDDVAEENKITEFSIVGWNQENPFFINANTGVISLWRTLDADGTQNKTFSFKVRAQNTKKMERPEKEKGQIFTEARVEINVTNVNDNPPKFIQNVYLFQVKETALQLFQISASDIDNDKIIYSLAGNHLPFIIDPPTGSIRLSGHLDYESKSMYNFSILATDDGQPQRSASADVVILVENMNTKAPIANDKMTFSILEEQPKGTLIGCIQATDPDGDCLVYSTDSKDFSVNSTSGELKSQSVFDYEHQIQYRIIVQVSDKLHKINITVTINVIDINDNDPLFSDNEYKTNLTDFNNGSSVIKLSAKDGDKNDDISYSLIGDSDFEILPDGEILLARNLDWKTKENSITLMASAFDLKNSSTSVLVSLLLIKPLEFARNNFTTSISEAAQVGTTVFQLEPCDFVDRTVTIRNLAIDLSNKSLFEYDKKCGCIRTKARLDREKVEMQEITMELKDKHGTHQANLRINIEDINDEPPILDRVKEAIELSDDSEPGLFIIKMNATDKDKDKDNGFTYFLKETCGKFVIDAKSGVIRSCGRFNYRLKPEYNLTVVVIDHGSPPLESNQTLTIRITDGNRHQPMFEKPLFMFTVNESTSAGHLIGQVNATDGDQGANGQLIFQIIHRNKNYAFAIGKYNGTVWVNNSKALDYEMTKMFNLTVEVRDSGTNPKSSTAILLVNLEDINDNSPVFKSPKFVSKHLPFPEQGVVFTVYAVDADSSKNGYNKITYSQLNLNKTFYTNPLSGEVRSKSKLSNVKMYTVNFQACDKGGNCAKQSVKLSTYSNIPNVVQVDEGVQNAFVIDINATEGDSDVFYTLISCNEYFTINSSTGIVRTQKPLVWHHQNNEIPITVVVQHSDNESNSTEIQITVQVVDVNDHYPEFSQKTYTFQIDENAKKTFDIQATDMDGGKNALITYSFFPSKPQVAEGSILLNSTTGTLNIYSLDRETQPRYTFSIRAKDKGQPPKDSTAKVTIELLDINDNAPIFTKDEYEANVTENSEPQKILSVHANDVDAGLNGTVYYELQNKSVPFSINQITGDIWSMEGLDFEKNSMYKLQVVASDQGENPKISLCSVSIHVLDICDEVPQLTTIISLSKDKIVGTPVFSLKSSENGTNYNLSVENNIVAINEKTGNVFTNSQIPKNATNYHMTVTAWSHCDLPVLTKFEIKPEDPLPKTGGKKLKAEITENHCSNQSIFNLSSIQEFQGIDVIFELRTFIDYFRIENGQIYCQTSVDREKYSQIVLLIDVTFKNRPIAYTADETLKIVVTVNDVNDHHPRFQSLSLFYSIPSTARFFYRVEKIKVIDEDAGENGASQFSLSEGDKDLFYINPSSGELHTLFDAAHSTKSEFSLQVRAVDQNGKGQAAKAPLKVSIYNSEFNIEMTVNKPVDFVEKILDSFIGNLSKILGFEIVVDQVQVHQNSAQKPDLQRSDILFHALDLKNKNLVSEEIVDRKMKAKKASIDNLLHQFGMLISQVKHVFGKEAKKTHKMASSEVVIIVLACLIFVGCILGIIMAVVMTRRQQKKLRDLKASMMGKSTSPSEFLEMSNPVFDNSKEYSSTEISAISDDSASTNRYNGDLPNQNKAEYNQSFQGKPSHPKDHESETHSAKDGYPSLSNSSEYDKERSEIGAMENANSELLVPASPPTINSASDSSSCLQEPSGVPGSGVASKNQNSDLDTGDVMVQMGSNALDIDKNIHLSEKPAENGRPILYNMKDDDLITEL